MLDKMQTAYAIMSGQTSVTSHKEVQVKNTQYKT